jgi:hypothetical protein
MELKTLRSCGSPQFGQMVSVSSVNAWYWSKATSQFAHRYE